jgi:hypothetical protein
VKDNNAWQERWRKLIVLPSQRYNAPSGAIGRCFILFLAEELKGIVSQKWNSKRFIVFQMVVLQRARDVKTSSAI